MKDIAEYFRELAATDRFFGAEPPTPDADMLAQIAARANQGAVEAEFGDNQLKLRPSAGSQKQAAPLAAPLAATITTHEPEAAPQAKAEAEAEPEADADASMIDAIAKAAAEETAEAVEASAQVEPQEAELAPEADGEIAPEVDAQTDAQTDGETNEETDGETGEDTIAARDVLVSEAVAASLSDPYETATEALKREGADASDPEADASADEDSDANLFTPDDGPAESVSERFARIQQVVAQSNADFARDDTNALLDDGDGNTQDFSLGSVSDEIEAVAQPQTEPQPEPEATLDTSPEAPQEVAEDVAQEMAQEVAPVAEAPNTTAPEADLPEAIEADLPDADLPEAIEADLPEEAQAPEAIEADVPAAQSTADAAPKSDPAKPLAVVRKVTRAAGISDLSPEDEAELQAELAAIEAEVEAVRRAGAESLPPPADEDAQALDRLFADTDNRLKGEETSRRHANISHLKAAVAARQADHKDGTAPAQADATGAYRDDLATAVRPRRPQQAAQTARPSAPTPEATGKISPRRPAPLVLVSEQRVDNSDDEAAVRPRRVSSASTDVRSNASGTNEMIEAISRAAIQPRRVAPERAQGLGFANFASDLGAKETIDMLEAAAVYATTVEDSDSFSRPQVLRLVAEALPNYTREEGQGAFAELLRIGQFEKHTRGTYRLARDSRFEAPARQRAAGE